MRVSEVGRLDLRPVDPESDVELLHEWLTHPKSAFWLMQDADLAQVRDEYRGIHDSPHHEAFIGLHEGEPAFLVERYDPAHDDVGKAYEVQEGDKGMHFLVAPTDEPVHGFTRAVIERVMELMFSDPDVLRVVVEPDVRNTAVHELNAAVGFQVEGEVELPVKTALLSTCTRKQFEEALA